jgi:hypothetical protein
MKRQEIQRLAVVDPDYYKLAIEMERLYRDGHHFRGDRFWTVTARLKDAPVGTDPIKFTCEADDAAGSRKQFREQYDDTKRPFKYKTSCIAAVPGLGRNFAWYNVDIPLVQINA